MAQARRIVDESLRDNYRRQAAAPNLIERTAFLGGKYPLPFGMAVGATCLLVGAVFIPTSWGFIPLPNLPSDYAHPAYFGAAWSVQATLVALVYPIVLTFVAIMLQRRALSKVALRVYMLDSGVLPAGASSVLLLALMTLQYLLAYYIPNDYFLAMAACIGTWLLTNILLTGVFLARTVRYIEDEVGQRAYKNLGVALVLREELVATLSQHLWLNAADAMGWSGAPASVKDRGPRVYLTSYGSGEVQVTRTFSREATLNDVHIGVVEWVGRRWLKRAQALAKSETPVRPAVLQINVAMHNEVLGAVDICTVTAGPNLSSMERRLLGKSLAFGKPPRRFISSTTLEMLEELGVEVQSLAEQRRTAALEQAFDRMTGFHIALLEACDETASEGGETTSAAGIARSPYRSSTRSLNSGWIEAYRPLIQLAVSQIDSDDTLMKLLPRVPKRVVAGSKLRLPKLIDEVFLVVTLLDHYLTLWWQKESQRQLVTSGSEGGLLPQPWGHSYRDALVAVVDGLINFRFPRVDGRQAQVARWGMQCNEALTWASHIELAATLLLDAVGRGDIEACNWHGDQFVNWWDSHQFELEYQANIDYMPGVCDLRLGVVELDWAEAEALVQHLAEASVASDVVLQVVWHAVRRYWESMRLVVCLLLLQEAEEGKFSQLAATVAARVLKLKLAHTGPHTSGLDLTDADELLALYVDTCFTDARAARRLDEFCERRQRFKKNPPVLSGLGYSGSGEVNDIASKSMALCQLLLALQPGPRQPWNDSRERLTQHKDNLTKLESIGWVLGNCVKSLRTKAFRPYLPVVDLLRNSLEKPLTKARERHPVFKGLRRLRDRARELRHEGLLGLVVADREVALVAERLSVKLMRSDALVRYKPFCAVEVRPEAIAPTYSFLRVQFTRENLTSPPRRPLSDSDVESMADTCLKHTFVQALARLLTEAKVPPIAADDPALMLSGILKAATAMRAAGMVPLAVVSVDEASNAVRPYNWGRLDQPALPEGITLGYGQQGELAFAEAYVNDVAVITSATPMSSAYVLPLQWLARLAFNGASERNVVSVKYDVVGPNEVRVDFAWNAAFPRPGTLLTQDSDDEL